MPTWYHYTRSGHSDSYFEAFDQIHYLMEERQEHGYQLVQYDITPFAETEGGLFSDRSKGNRWYWSLVMQVENNQ